MNLTTERADILAALTKVAGIVARKTTIDIIANVLIDARKSGEVHLRATNLDMEATAVFRGNVTEAGVITVPSELLMNIVRNLDAGADLKLSTSKDDVRAKLQAGRSRFSLPMLPPKDFPELRPHDQAEPFEIAASEFLAMLDATAFAAGHEAARYYICGVYLHVRDGALVSVATDGHRLAKYTSGPVAPFDGVIVPTEFSNHAARLLKDFDGDISVAIGGTGISLGVGDAHLTSKVIDGSYPDYPRVIPDNPHTLRVGRSTLEGGIRRAMSMSSEGVRLDIGADSLTITAKGQNSADAIDEVSIEYDGEPMDIGFNAKYVLEALAHLSGDQIEIKLADKNTPAVFTDPNDAARVYLVMAYRV